jgi:hypothetical protein
MSIIDLFREWRARHRNADSRAAVDTTEPEWNVYARRRGQRVVFADWVGIWTISEAGTPYFAERTDLQDQIEVLDPRERNLAFFQAAERFPDLKQLRPLRAAGDYDCPYCQGTGRAPVPPGVEGRIWCSCGGVGWLPAGYVEPPGQDHINRVESSS